MIGLEIFIFNQNFNFQNSKHIVRLLCFAHFFDIAKTQ